MKCTLEFNKDERNKNLLSFYFSRLNWIDQISFLQTSSPIQEATEKVITLACTALSFNTPQGAIFLAD